MDSYGLICEIYQVHSVSYSPFRLDHLDLFLLPSKGVLGERVLLVLTARLE